MTDTEQQAPREVNRIVYVDPELAVRTVGQSWFTDGIDYFEANKVLRIRTGSYTLPSVETDEDDQEGALDGLGG